MSDHLNSEMSTSSSSPAGLEAAPQGKGDPSLSSPPDIFFLASFPPPPADVAVLVALNKQLKTKDRTKKGEISEAKKLKSANRPVHTRFKTSRATFFFQWLSAKGLINLIRITLAVVTSVQSQ